ncbi:histidine kinase [Bacillus toyonensis]|uniref:YheC/YheD family endospore coat-associated protein n=1 Tax=Bacillus toyonensis TaxID=155322 RepID=UPI000BFDB38A|nr:YheC/YheD family protein [Bacillus toyonensis]PHF82072.1 histidine kinase [Bacillus toyonensis]
MVLGILTSRPHYEQTYYTEIAKRARLYHNVVAQFTPFCIDPKTDLVSGLIYDTDTGKWKEQTFPIPSYIYDRSSFNEDTDFEKAKSIIHSLHNRPSTTFLNNTLIDLSELHDLFLTNKKLFPYIPKFEIATIQNIFKLLLKTKDIIIRPTHTHSNESLYRIAYKNKTFHIDTIHDAYHNSTPIKRTDEFISWYTSNIQSTRYITHTMLQPPNQLTYPLHIRTILQKNKEQKWNVIGQFIQKSSFPNQFLLSVTDDSSLHSLSKIKYVLSNTGVQLLQDALHDIINEVFQTLDQSYSSLFELELSTIMDQKGAIWLMYVNTIPPYERYIHHNDSLAEKIFHGPLKFSRFTP